MKLEYYKVDSKKQKGMHECPHNKECLCRTKDCYNCGWNPKVAQARSKKILKRMGVSFDG